ncbi:class I SAM-dependent methyltransferase [Patescibacteria group bacterium]|nr:class I SAM-dependent methyltransferase [Patescibacteria group bacterium]
MSLLRYFQKIKWEILAKLNPSYYVFSDKIISEDEIKYQKSGKDDFQRFILKDKALKKFLEDSQSKTCLEFGSGNGRMTEFLAGIFSKVYAVDISEGMIESAKKRLKYIENISYLAEKKDNKIGLDDKSVDFIFSYIVLQHLPSKKMVKDVLNKFYRILKNDGFIKIQIRVVPAHGGLFRYFKWYYGVSFSEKEIRNILKEIGFKVIYSKGEETKLFWLLIQKI